jgi:hypothetical protein
MKLNLPEGVSRKLARHALEFDKHSPTIFFAAGVVGTITSTALACRATLQVSDVLAKAEDDIRTAHTVQELKPEEYSDEEVANIEKHVRIRTAFEIGALYAPAIGVGLLGLAALTHSNNLLSRRNAAISAAYVAVDQAFREYRERVVEHYGPEKDRELRYGVEKVQVVDPETGRKKNVHRVTSKAPSQYAKFFGAPNPNWNGNAEYNLLFLRAQQEYANQLLHARGHVLLNDVYDGLGIARTPAGCVVGWVLGHGDDYIDFGLWDPNGNLDVIDFVKIEDGAILLDFNVDGLVYDLIGEDESVKEEEEPWHAG